MAVNRGDRKIKSQSRGGVCTLQLFPVGERHEFVKNLLQSLKPTFLISGCARYVLLSALHIESIRFTDLNDLLPQLRDALFDRTLHVE